MKSPRAFLLALVVAIIATVAQCRYVSRREKQLLYDSQPIPTLVAVKDIPARFKLDETMVTVIEVPRRWRQPKALSSVEDILGQITADPILKDEQVVSTKLVRADDAGLAYFVQKKHRAVAVAVDEVSAVGGHIKPSNYIDVLGTFDFGQGEKADMRTVTLFQNVRVLSVGDDIGQPTAATIKTSADLKAAEEGGEEVDLFNRDTRSPAQRLNQGKTITVEVTPNEAQKLVLAQELGSLSVTLRSLWEADRFVELESATVHSTLGIPQQVRYTPRPRYRLIQSGGF